MLIRVVRIMYYLKNTLGGKIYGQYRDIRYA
jgi:hypothetical protein